MATQLGAEVVEGGSCGVEAMTGAGLTAAGQPRGSSLPCLSLSFPTSFQRLSRCFQGGGLAGTLCGTQWAAGLL